MVVMSWQSVVLICCPWKWKRRKRLLPLGLTLYSLADWHNYLLDTNYFNHEDNVMFFAVLGSYAVLIIVTDVSGLYNLCVFKNQAVQVVFLKIGPIDCPKNSVNTILRCVTCRKSEKFHLYRGRSLQPHKRQYVSSKPRHRPTTLRYAKTQKNVSKQEPV